MRKSRHKSANIVEHRKRMKKMEQHQTTASSESPAYRFRSSCGIRVQAVQAFGKNQEVKSKVPTDPIAKSQIMQARKLAEESHVRLAATGLLGNLF